MKNYETDLHQPAADPKLWLLDPETVFLNHGSFGACPRRILEIQSEWRARMEHQPLQFLVREMDGHMDRARAALAQFVGADAGDLVFVPNATTGVNSVLRSLQFQPGDELLVTNQEYNACRNALDFVAERSGARVVVVPLPFPFQHEDELVAPILAGVTSRTRLVLVDHVTSQTGMVMPMARLVAELNARGVDTLVDGAHAPGMIPLNLKELGAAYYTGNCHKWMCTPKGVALLYVRQDKQSAIRPLTISHGANSKRQDRTRFILEFGWPGTWDPSGAMSMPETIQTIGSWAPGGWPEIMARNRALVLTARRILLAALKIAEPCPENYIGSLATIPLPDAPPHAWPRLPYNEHPLQDALRATYKIEVPIIAWPAPPKRFVRVSAQLYNSLPQYELLARALTQELPGA